MEDRSLRSYCGDENLRQMSTITWNGKLLINVARSRKCRGSIIRRERDHLAEDPVKEVAFMQYLKRWNKLSKRAHGHVGGRDGVAESFQAILDTIIMMPLDLLSDDRNLYSVMPFCGGGGKLFEHLDMNEKFSEDEARYWMNQILNVSRNCSLLW